MRKFGYDIIHLIQLIRFFGVVEGSRIFSRIFFSSKNKVVKFNSKRFRNQVRIRKSNSDIEIFYQVFCELQYDMLFYLDFTPRRIIDCGSNVGYSCLYFADKFQDAEIVAIEPESNNFALLELNTCNYGNIRRYHAAIWDHPAVLSIKDEMQGSAGFEMQEKDNPGSANLPGITISQVADENGFDVIDIVKLDIEGAEYDLFLNDPHDWLSRTKCLIIELHDNLKPGTSRLFFQEMAKYNWRTFIKGENIICFRDDQ